MLIMGLLGPEFMFVAAYSQFISARRSVKAFHASGFTSWTSEHAFFADAGGFVLETDKFPLFPVNAKQLHYLVTRGYLDLPTITRAQIGDRNKRDVLLRVITLIQITWFVINILLRLINNLHITALELTTLAFISCSLVSGICWFRKPADIRIPETLKAKVPLATILQQATADFRVPYYYTPLDFLSREEWVGSRVWAGYMNILRRLRLPGMHEARPIQRFHNSTTLVPLTGKHAWAMLGVTAVYAALFLAAWNHDFPSPVERLLWRTASLAIFVAFIACYFIERLEEDIVPALRRWVPLRPAVTEPTSSSPSRRPARFSPAYILDRARNNSLLQDPALDVPLYVNLPLYLVAVVYCSGRAVISVLDLLELRLLPADAYVLPQWSALLPHL